MIRISLAPSSLYALCALYALTGAIHAEDTAPPGISVKYPGDIGIQRDADVVFAEDFESKSLEEVTKRWSDAKSKGGKTMAFSTDSPTASRGKQSLQVTATLGEDDGGYLYKRLDRGHELLHARFYVKFAEDAGYTHHFVALGAYNPPTSWPQGGAGTKPRGDDRIYIGIEPDGNYAAARPPGAWSLYNYWHEMKISADGKFWGNAIQPEKLLQVPRGQWQCVEVMVRLNTTKDASDGALALWIDGVERLRVEKGTRRGPWSGMGFKTLQEGGEAFEGFRWRSSEDLKLNFFWLLHYVTENAARQNRVESPAKVTRVWFDHIVVATRHIGPIAP